MLSFSSRENLHSGEYTALSKQILVQTVSSVSVNLNREYSMIVGSLANILGHETRLVSRMCLQQSLSSDFSIKDIRHIGLKGLGEV